MMRRTVDKSPNGRDSSATRAGANGHPNGPGNAALAKIVGKGQAVHNIKESIRRISRFPNGPVLITGETGTGKELVADALHACSPRSGGPLIKVNCAAIPESLFESQFFGHRKGAFSGADYTQKGFVEAARDGVLFLDEISSLKLELQAKLLRFLENDDYVPVGETEARTSNAWIVTACNQNLVELANENLFRFDLCHRLKSVQIQVAPLRERQDDILPLASHFLKVFAKEFAKATKNLSTDVQYIFLNYPWAGNVRELRNLLRALMIKVSGRSILAGHLDGEMDLATPRSKTSPSQPYKIRPLQEIEKAHILAAFKATDYQIRKTARLLNISRNTLKRKLTAYGLR